jgi:Regulator of chromosome condensation (RCC1) repeat
MRDTSCAFLTKAAVACLSLLLASCDNSRPRPLVVTPNQPAAPNTIGPAGGVVNGPGRSQIIVPAGALAQHTAIAITADARAAPGLPAAGSFGSSYALLPHGTRFAVPVTVVLPNDLYNPPGTVPAVYKTNAVQSDWERVPAQDTTVSRSEIRVQVSSFSWIVSGVAPPSITGEPVPTTITAGQAAQFIVTAESDVIDRGELTDELTYQWQRSDDGGVTFMDVTDATESTLVVTPVEQDNGARFRAQVSGSGGVTMSDPATLLVMPLTCSAEGPVIVTNPLDQTVNVGASATFSVAATGSDLTYQWLRTSSSTGLFNDIPGATGSSYTLADARSADSGVRFRVRISNSQAIIQSLPAQLTVNAPAHRGMRVGGGASFSVARLPNSELISWGAEGQFGLLGAGPGEDFRLTPGPVASLLAVVSFSVGPVHTLAVRSNGDVWGWGYNLDYQLGSPTGAIQSPTLVAGVSNVAAVCAGGSHSLFLLADRTVWALGTNTFGQLGDGTNTTATSVPVQVKDLQDVVEVACGIDYSMARLGDGTVHAWGRNQAGQLGDDTKIDRNTAAPVIGLSAVTAIAAGENHSLAISSGGSVWAWGQNGVGELGDGTIVERLLPVQTLANANFTAVAANGGTSVALRNDGRVFVWGTNESGQLANGTLSGSTSTPLEVDGLDLVEDIAIGRQPGAVTHLLVMRSDGTMRAWGLNDFGQVGNSVQGTPVREPALVLLQPEIAVQPQSIIVPAGSDATFSVTAVGGDLSYAWERSDDGGVDYSPILNANTATLTISSAATSDHNARLRVQVTNAAGTARSNSVVLQVTDP